jgi:hypothetical protein
VKLKSKLSLVPNPVQRRTPSFNAGRQLLKNRAGCPASWPTAKNHPFTLWAASSRKPVRITPPIIGARAALRGDKSYLRALRAAEMAAWNANVKFPAWAA